MESKRVLKKGISMDDGRRRREAACSIVRKDKKEEGLAKRRNLNAGEGDAPLNNVTTDTSKTPSPLQDETDYVVLVKYLGSPNVKEQVDALRRFRRLLSTEKNPPVQACIDCGAIPYIVSFLTRVDSSELQFEAAWALTNIASTSFTSIVVTHGAIPLLITLLTSPSADVREQCAWCLGNIAGDGPELRDVLLKHNALGPLLLNITNPENISLLRNCVWALSNMCRGKPAADMALLAPAYPVLAGILKQNADAETMIDATWALSYLSDGDDARIAAVVSLGVIPIFVQMLASSRVNGIIPALRCLGNIVSGNDSQTQAVVDGGVLNYMCPLLVHGKKNIRKEACWMLSNIAAGSAGQLSQLVSTPSLMNRVLEQMAAESEWEVRKEAAWVVSNIVSGGSAAQIGKLVECGVVRPLCDLLDVAEVKVLLISLDTIEVSKYGYVSLFMCVHSCNIVLTLLIA
jgi:HEAT repeat protein